MTEDKRNTIKSDPEQLGKTLTYDEELYLDIRAYIQRHLDLVEDAEYDVLTAKVLESWLIFKFNEVGYIFFIGPPRSGKTRGLETMAELCFNSKLAAYMTTPTIFRILDNMWCTLFLDEIQQYLDGDRFKFLALLNAGQRRGAEAIISVPVKRNWTPKGFKVFGSKFLASTEDTAKALATRCIFIPMVKNARQVPMRIDAVEAEKLRKRIDDYTFKVGAQTFPDLTQAFFDRGFKDYRNIETFINLVTVTPPIYRKRILDYALAIDSQIAEEEGITFYADIFAAIEFVYASSTGGKIGVSNVLDIYNETKTEQEKMTPQSMGIHLNIMGLRRKTRMSGGYMGRYVSPKLMERLKRRYAPPQTTLGVEGGGNEESEGSEGKGV